MFMLPPDTMTNGVYWRLSSIERRLQTDESAIIYNLHNTMILNTVLLSLILFLIFLAVVWFLRQQVKKKGSSSNVLKKILHRGFPRRGNQFGPANTQIGTTVRHSSNRIKD